MVNKRGFIKTLEAIIAIILIILFLSIFIKREGVITKDDEKSTVANSLVKSDATSDMIDRLPKSPVGTCILSGTYETVKHAIPLKIREMETQDADSGQAPPIFDEAIGFYS